MISLATILAVLPLILQALIEFFKFLCTKEGQKMLEQNRINWDVWAQYWNTLISNIDKEKK